MNADNEPSRDPKDAGALPERYPDMQVSNPAPPTNSNENSDIPNRRLIMLMQMKLATGKLLFAWRGNDDRFYSPVFDSKAEAEAWKEKHGISQPITLV